MGAMPGQTSSIPRTSSPHYTNMSARHVGQHRMLGAGMPSAPHVALGMYAPAASSQPQEMHGHAQSQQQPRSTEGQYQDQPERGSEKSRCEVVDREVQTEDKSKVDVGVGDDRPHGQAIMPEGIAGVGIFSLEHARKEQEERQKQTEAGQGRTILTAEGPSAEPTGHVSLPALHGTRGPLNRTHPAETPECPPQSDSKVCAKDTQSTGEGNASPVAHDSDTRLSASDVPAPASATSMPQQRSVPLGMEPGVASSPTQSSSIAQPTFSSTTPSDSPDVAPSSTSPSSTQASGAPRSAHQTSDTDAGGVEPGPARTSGFFSDLFHEAGEVISDVGDVARYYVPGVGYLLRKFLVSCSSYIVLMIHSSPF